MKRLILLVCCVFFITLHSSSAQEQASVAQVAGSGDSLDYFPYRAGDTWRVRNADTQKEDYTLEVFCDSVDSIGNRFFLADVWFEVDTSGDVFIQPGQIYAELRYRLRAKVGDRWKSVPGVPESRGYVTCAGIYPMNVYGEVRMVKEFHYWSGEEQPGGQLDSFWYSTRWLARGFGEVKQYYEPDALFYVSGAIIAGRAYGDMTPGGVFVPSTGASPLLVAPNPFTAGATISYHLDSRQHVRLTLCDALGRVVAVAVDEVQDAGDQTVSIEGTALGEGRYFYHLRTATHTTSGTLIRQR